jgi:galactose-1-phosphate uridylyltransferase
MKTDNLKNETTALSKGAVSGSISLTANVPKQFAEAVKKLHKGYNIELKEYKEYKHDWITVVVQGSKDNLEKLNRECEKIAYGF